jgi:ATP/maltotriose-dependent transcriptional regulator MalT/DNA-binding XRE family transcriptional regulator
VTNTKGTETGGSDPIILAGQLLLNRLFLSKGDNGSKIFVGVKDMAQPGLTHATGTKPATFTSFGALLKYLRRRERMTQRDLALAVGYTEAHLCRLEKNQRLPDQTTVAALFVPALSLEREPEWAERLLELATSSRHKHPAASPLLPEADQAATLLEAIPPLPPYHVARPPLLARLRQHLTTERGLALCGLAGVGKTTLAATYAHERAPTEPVFWLSLTVGVTASVEAVIRRLALFLLAQGQTQVKPLVPISSDDTPPIPLDQQISLIGAVLAQQPGLLCFDDLHLVHNDVAILSLLRHLLTTTPASLLLISREEVSLLGVMSLRLVGLEHDEGLALVEQLAIHTPGADARIYPYAERLLDRTGGNPMLLKLAIGQIHDDLTAPDRFIDHLETQPQVAAYVLETVLRDLSPAAIFLTELLSVFRQPVNLYDEDWPELLQETPVAQDQAAAMAELQRRHLIDHPVQAALHPLVRDHVYATLSAKGRHKRRLHHLAARWSEFVARDVLEAAHHYTNAAQLAQAVEALTDQVEALLNQGQAFNAVALVDEMLAQVQRGSKIPLNKPPDNSQDLIRQLLTIRGDLLVHTLRTAEAEENYRQALLLTTQPEVWANIVHRLAGYLLQHGQGYEAARMCREAAALVPNHTLLLAQLAAIESAAHVSVGSCEEAERMANQALALASQLLSVMPQIAESVRARAYGTLGEAQRYQSRPEAALASWQNAIDAARRAELRRLEYRYPGNMGLMLIEQGWLDEALRLCHEALTELTAIGDSYAAAQALAVIGYAHHVRGDQATALSFTERAGDLRRRLGDSAGAAVFENLQVWSLFIMGRITDALSLAERNKREIEKLGPTWLVAQALDTLSIIQLITGELAQAGATLREAFAMPDIANKWIYHFLFDDLALVHLAGGEVIQAQQTLDEAPPAVGFWQELDRHLVRGMIVLAQGDRAAARASAAVLAERAEAVGYGLFVQRAARLVEAIENPPPLADLPRFMWVDGP